MRKEKKFQTEKQALLSLANYFYEKYKLSFGDTSYRKCCKKNQKDPEAQFCKRCGADIDVGGFNEDKFRDFLYDLKNSDCDSYGIGEDGELSCDTWMPTGLPPAKQTLVIDQNAEKIILCALNELYPELEIDTYFDEEEEEEEYQKIK